MIGIIIIIIITLPGFQFEALFFRIPLLISPMTL